MKDVHSIIYPTKNIMELRVVLAKLIVAEITGVFPV
jgi:hypothetical protein